MIAKLKEVAVAFIHFGRDEVEGRTYRTYDDAFWFRSVLVSVVRDVVWPIAKSMGHGGQLMADYFYRYNGDLGPLNEAFGGKPGSSVRLVTCRPAYGERDDVAAVITKESSS
jgi:hypothetical protein